MNAELTLADVDRSRSNARRWLSRTAITAAVTGAAAGATELAPEGVPFGVAMGTFIVGLLATQASALTALKHHGEAVDLQREYNQLALPVTSS